MLRKVNAHRESLTITLPGLVHYFFDPSQEQGICAIGVVHNVARFRKTRSRLSGTSQYIPVFHDDIGDFRMRMS